MLCKLDFEVFIQKTSEMLWDSLQLHPERSRRIEMEIVMKNHQMMSNKILLIIIIMQEWNERD